MEKKKNIEDAVRTLMNDGDQMACVCYYEDQITVSVKGKCDALALIFDKAMVKNRKFERILRLAVALMDFRGNEV